MEDYGKLIECARERDALQERLKSLEYGSLEIRERGGRFYVYRHFRESGSPRTAYVGERSEALLQRLAKENEEAKAIRKRLRELGKTLKGTSYEASSLSHKVQVNVDLAKRNIVDTIYRQAVLEGVAVTFPDTEAIIEGGKVSGVSASDVQKVVNLKRAWQFTLEEGTLLSPSDLSLLCYINRLVQEGFTYTAGTLRSVPVSIGGSSYRPPLPIESLVKEGLADIMAKDDVYERAILSFLYPCREQFFIDGNKRTALIFANHVLIKEGAGILSIPEDRVGEFRDLLVAFYESNDPHAISGFLAEYALTRI